MMCDAFFLTVATYWMTSQTECSSLISVMPRVENGTQKTKIFI